MNPFLINNYIDPEYFCDRIKETEAILRNIDNQSNTAFFSQRRIGKSALIHHVFHHLKKQGKTCFYMDIYSSQSLKDFSEQLANAIYKHFPEKNNGKKLWESLKLLRPVLSINELSGNPEISLDFARSQHIEQSIPHLLDFLDSQKKHIVIAIDEFQQILNYPEKNVEAILRTSIQRLTYVNFIFCGSDQKLMNAIFNNSKRPFYSSSKSIRLGKINKEDYTAFIKRHFNKKNIKIEDAVIDQILTYTSSHTYYTQRLCHELYSYKFREITTEKVNQALFAVLQDSENVYFQYRNLLTKGQWSILKAIAIEGEVTQPLAKDFIFRHKLGTPASVKRSLESLLDKGLVYKQILESTHYYEVQDKFFMWWLRQ